MAFKKPIVIDSLTNDLSVIISGDYIDTTALGSGTPSVTTYLRGDNSWATPSSSGATPGGTVDNQIQYRSGTGTTFGGSPNLTFDPTNTVLSLLGTNPKIIVNSLTTEPSTPTVGTLAFYSKSVAGKVLPKYLSSTGFDMPLQAGLAFENIMTVRPSSGASQTVIGCAVTNVGTLTTPTLAATNQLTSTRRTLFTSVATAGALASQYSNSLLVSGGAVQGYGGFMYVERFSLSVLAAGNRFFCGLADSLAAPTNVDPTTSSAVGKIGIGINANSGAWNLVNNIVGTVPTVLALNSLPAIAANDILELTLYSASASSVVGYRFRNITGTGEVSGILNANIPAPPTFLAPWKYMTNNATATSVAFNSISWTLETDI